MENNIMNITVTKHYNTDAASVTFACGAGDIEVEMWGTESRIDLAGLMLAASLDLLDVQGYTKEDIEVMEKIKRLLQDRRAAVTASPGPRAAHLILVREE